MPDPTVEQPRTRGHKKKARTRRQLLAAAVDVIAERGESFTIGHVVARAGVSNGTFYNYFDDRDQLIDAVVPEALAAFAAEGAATVVDDDPATRFATITALAFVRARSAPDAVRVVLRLEVVQEAISAGQIVNHLRSDLIDGVATGRFDLVDIDAALDVVIGAMLLAARRIVDSGAAGGADGAVTDDYPAQVIELLLCSFGLERAEAATIAGSAVARAVQLHHDATDDPSGGLS